MPKRRTILLSCTALLAMGLLALVAWQSSRNTPAVALPWLSPNVDVYIQAGHENRTTGRTGASGALGREQEWTPVVADAAAKALTDAGFTVLRTDANLWRFGRQRAHLALFIHFDGSNPSCRSGASIGYGAARSADAAGHWRRFYRRFWPYEWMPDNFSRNLSGYYGYRYVDARDAELVLELGEITCAKQAEWLQPRLGWLGERIAEFATQRLCHDIAGDAPHSKNCPAEPLVHTQVPEQSPEQLPAVTEFDTVTSPTNPEPRKLALLPPSGRVPTRPAITSAAGQ